MGSNNIADLSRWAPPQRLIKGPNGRTIVEKLSPLLSRKVVDLAGNVVQQPASNGIANRSPDDPYGAKSHAEKLHGRPNFIKGTPGGILPYSKCPQGLSGVSHWLEEAGVKRGVPCESAHNGKAISNSDPCKCIVAVIEYRQKVAREEAEKVEERVNKLAMLAERNAQANLDASSKLAEAAAALAKASEGQGRGHRGGSGGGDK